MKNLLLLLFVSALALSCNGQSEKVNEDGSTTYYLIRHAEKDRSNPEDSNPSLTDEGAARADRWAAYFQDKNIHAVYSTHFNRTLETAGPTAESFKLEVQTYDPTKLFDNEFKEATASKNVVVVGHSNTTPMFANAIIGVKQFEMMSDDDNTTIFIIKKIGKNQEISVEVVD